MGPMYMRWLRYVGSGLAVAMLALCVWGAVIVDSATASEGKPLAITKFTMQTTAEEEIQALKGRRLKAEALTPESFGFANIPYTFTQAGGHPVALTTSFEFAHEEVAPGVVMPTRDVRDIAVTLPPGLLGNPTAVPRCPLAQALAFGVPCPVSTQVGEAVVYFGQGVAYAGPIVNATPERGQSAEFAVETNTKVNAALTARVIHGPDGYDLQVVSNGLTQEIVGAETTFWGVPAAPVHNGERGLFCARTAKALGTPNDTPWECGGEANLPNKGGGGEASNVTEAQFLTMPSNCSAGPETATARADSWEQPGLWVSGPSATLPAATGCSLLQFAPSIGMEPDTFQADAPVGPEVTVKVPQYEQPARLSTPELRSATVTLPPGMSVNPGSADGIRACNATGPEGINFEGPESEKPGANGEPQLAPGECPEASTIGEAEVITPLLSEPVKGHIYLARPECGGAGESACTPEDVADGKVYRLYLELGGTGQLAVSGVHLKVPGRVKANPATGQLTTVFEGLPVPGEPSKYEGNPQLPFSELKVRLNGGPRAPLANPAICGQAVTTASFSTWSGPGKTPEGLLVEGLPNVVSSSFFPVDLVGDERGTPCPALPFAPGYVAGTVTASAGKFTSFTLNIGRKDREQPIHGVQVHMPPGVLGMVSRVPLCGEAQADAGSCPAASKIGTARTAVGAGSHPFEFEGGVYLTGPHDGAPFGLSIVTPAVAGPFNLGTVVVRARVDIDPATSALTVTTDESGPHAIPQIWMGVPLRLQRIMVNVDRPDFMLNPTSCRAQQVAAAISSSQQVVANVSSPFAVGGCRNLAFKPVFKAFTSGRTSRKRGASLDTSVTFPKNAMGNDANVAYVKVTLPKRLPSYVPTLNHSCLVETFDSNPSACPKDSVVGIARAYTPALPVLHACHARRGCPPPESVEGPAYFVSHGGAQFPQLVVVLEGDGVRVDLVGDTFISKGITTTTFKTVPDVPVDSFELYLPQGKNHALAAPASLCKNARKLMMPTKFVAQNGMVFRQNTKIKVTGCGKPKHKQRRHTAHAGHRRSVSAQTTGRTGR